MQTFVPYPDIARTASVLDMKRLGKQRVETLQLLMALKLPATKNKGWLNHPAKRMWEGHELALLRYQELICHEWVALRGYRDTCWAKSLALFSEEELLAFAAGAYTFPKWWGDPEVHLSHRANLLRKDSEAYGGVFEEELDPELPYVWPNP